MKYKCIKVQSISNYFHRFHLVVNIINGEFRVDIAVFIYDAVSLFDPFYVLHVIAYLHPE